MTTTGPGELAIADTPDKLTVDWLRVALARAPAFEGTTVSGVEITPVGTGQMCDSMRLALSFEGEVAAGVPRTIVAKLPAADPTSRATALMMRSYEVEVRFYQELAPTLPIRTPLVHHADIDTETASFVLLMEDMAPARQGDQLAGCDLDTAIVAIDELVKLHAPRWGDPDLRDIEWLERDKEGSMQMGLMLLPNLWDGFQDRYATVLAGEVREAGTALFASFERYLLADTQPWTVMHGDYRLDNLLFDPSPEGTPIAVVDWQTVTIGPALVDVSYFIGAGLPADVRRSEETALVRRYHDALLAAGVTGYDWDRCWHDYARSTFAGLVMAVGASMLVERTERGDEMFMAMASRHSRHALDLGAPDLLTA